jgi:hypothetical protein
MTTEVAPAVPTFQVSDLEKEDLPEMFELRLSERTASAADRYAKEINMRKLQEATARLLGLGYKCESWKDLCHLEYVWRFTLKGTKTK